MSVRSALVAALVLVTPCLAGSVDLKYEVAGHVKVKTISADECTNMNGLKGVTSFEASADCILYSMVDCLGVPTPIFQGSHKYPSLIVTGSIQCNGEHEEDVHDSETPAKAEAGEEAVTDDAGKSDDAGKVGDARGADEADETEPTEA